MRASVDWVLKVEELTMDFGGLRAMDKVDLWVGQREIVALIGPNGAGKTTFFNCVTGIYNPGHGSMMVRGRTGGQRTLNGLKPNKVTEQGLARTFQNIRLFSGMTVLENVMIGCHCRNRTGIFGAIFRPRSARLEEERIVAKSYAILEQIGIASYVNELAGNLPYGAQRRLEIARALATEPEIILLDEPAAGMNPRETRELDELILRIRDEWQLAVLLIEHDMKLVMSLSDRIYVMDYGKKIAEGTVAEIRTDPVVIQAYLGDAVA